MKTDLIENSPVGSRTITKHGDGGRGENENSLDKKQKSILIIDTPATCTDCPCYDYIHGICDNTHKNCELRKQAKPSWCPLRPLPKKKNTDFHPNIVYANGWNDCLKELEK